MSEENMEQEHIYDDARTLIKGLRARMSEPFDNIWESDDLIISGTADQRAAMFKSYAEYFAQVTNPENTTMNTFFKQKYAPLNEVLNTIRPVLGEHGISVVQATGADDDGHAYVQTLLLHQAGGYMCMPTLKAKPADNKIQSLGATLTYLRRFALNALAGVNGEIDDDGNSDGEARDDKDKKKKLTPRQELAAVARDKAKVNREKVHEVLVKYAESGAIKDVPEDKINDAKKDLEGLQ